MNKTNTNKNGITAIYVRRSVSDKDKGNNSLSIDAQKEDCIKFAGDCEYQVYCDDGKSGKDVEHRPAFMAMMRSKPMTVFMVFSFTITLTAASM